MADGDFFSLNNATNLFCLFRVIFDSILIIFITLITHNGYHYTADHHDDELLKVIVSKSWINCGISKKNWNYFVLMLVIQMTRKFSMYDIIYNYIYIYGRLLCNKSNLIKLIGWKSPRKGIDRPELEWRNIFRSAPAKKSLTPQKFNAPRYKLEYPLQFIFRNFQINVHFKWFEVNYNITYVLLWILWMFWLYFLIEKSLI